MPGPGPDQRAAIERWYRRAARDAATAQLDAAALALGRPYARLTIREQRTRWGSCSATGCDRHQLAARARPARAARVRRLARGLPPRRARPLAALLGAPGSSSPGLRGPAALAARQRGGAAAVSATPRVGVVGHIEWIQFAVVPGAAAPRRDPPRLGGVRARGGRRRRRGGAARAARGLGDVLHRGGRRRPRRAARATSCRTGGSSSRRPCGPGAPTRRGFTYLDDEHERTITLLDPRHGPARRRPAAVGADREPRRRLLHRRRPGGAARRAHGARARRDAARAGRHRPDRRRSSTSSCRARPTLASRSTPGRSIPRRGSSSTRAARTAAPGPRATVEAGEWALGAASRAAGRRVRLRRLVRGRAHLRARRRACRPHDAVRLGARCGAHCLTGPRALRRAAHAQVLIGPALVGAHGERRADDDDRRRSRTRV